MRQFVIAITAAAALTAPCLAVAQLKNQPGQSEYAPGQRQKEPGDAKKYAPGQQEQRYDKDKQPGAKEYAPGHQPSK
jgi:hypothetical protein